MSVALTLSGAGAPSSSGYVDIPESHRLAFDLEASLRQVVVEIQPSEIFGVHPAGHARGVSVPGRQIEI